MKKRIAEFLELFLILTGALALIWIFLAEPLEVTGESMLPTLKNKEQIVTEKFTTNFSDLKRGDIVVVKSPQNEDMWVIKRVIALPGEAFLIDNGEVYIDSQKLNEPYLKEQGQTNGRKKIRETIQVTVAEDAYIILGDNREHSTDSRDFGEIKKENVIGKALFVYYPLENLRFLDHVDVNPFLTSSLKDEVNDSVNF